MEPAHGLPYDGARPEKYDFKYPEQVEITRRLGLVWMRHLSASEFKIVHWLICNTVLRGHRSGEYSQVQICSGVRSRNGGMWAEGTGLSERIVRDAVKSLRDMGLLHTEPGEWSTRFTVITTWSPETGQAEESNVVALNLPRARRAQTQPTVHMQAAEDGEWDAGAPAEFAGDDRQNLPVGGGRICPPSNRPSSNPSPTNEEPDTTASRPVATIAGIRIRRRPSGAVASPVPVLARSGFGKVEASPRCAAPPPAETVEEAIHRVQGDRVARLQALRQRKDAHAFERTWAAAWADAYEGRPCVAWTKKSAGMLKKAVARWPEKALGSVHDFLDWSVRNWDAIRLTKLARLKTPSPTQPDIEFLARFISSFQEAWADKEELRWRGTLPGTRQSVLFLMRSKGVSEDVALAQVIAAQRNDAERTKLEKIRADTQRDRRVAEIAADNARRAKRFTAANPHPRAAENAPYVPPRIQPPADEAGTGFGIVQAVTFKMDDA
ncbi:hypothetical protein E4V01_00440 [Methylorubrum sp. Q1]|uniref:hypothetical protein n=1 Tax=Methylorubrum sp. Q1 TaxID=2562453 RepID=UPI0010768BA2|nr:hypothetical protein [Methylorubrum sp. Q1]TFZ61116.1 hypothetical protein E4V01_00440 [Methylorubrum sp. Q1]